MEKLFFVTGNREKFLEVQKMLEDRGITVEQSNVPVIERKYNTEREVSIGKALAAVRQVNAPVIVEDTGIYFDAYTNFPGPNAHVVFGGIGFEGILKLLEGEKRGAFFRTAFAYCKPGMHPVTFIGECQGKIAEKISDIIDFDYDALFIPYGDERTFSEMSKKEKKVFSHRGKALELFMEWYQKNELKEKKDLNDIPPLEKI